MRARWMGITMVMLAIVVVACTLGWGQGSGVTITVVRGTDLWTADPHNDTQVTSQSLFHNVFDPLIRVNWEDPAHPLPALAESWEVLSDTQIQFNLRQGVTWHDGSPFTADDVKFTFDRILNPDEPTKISSWITSIVSGVTVVDPYTIILEMFKAYAPIYGRLETVKIIPKIAFEAMGAEAFGLSPVGTGAYIFAEWKQGEYIRMVANEDWWGWVDRETRPDVVIRKSLPEGFTRYAMLEGGEADIVGQIPPERIEGIEATEDLRIETIASTRGFFVGMNTWEPPFDDVRVRQAMNYAIDKQLIVDTILGGQATVHAGVCTLADFGYCADCMEYEYNPEKARQLLADAGYPDGFTVTFWSPRGKYIQDLETSEAIAGQLEEVGITVEVYAPAWAEYWDNWLAGNHQMYLLSYGGSFPDCDDRIGGHIDGARRGLYYNSPESDLLIQQEQQTLDPDDRAAIWADLSAYLIEDAPWIFLWDLNLIYGVTDKIKTWTPVPVEHIYYWQIGI